ncbi:MAG TPA: PHP-associated domain-containing protein [Methanomassiliicoccaceae archaeon]|nr:PHP-associated domain-containing protein [Methanomassiliicoccaceae archaeon]
MQGKADIHVHTKYSGLHRMAVLRFPESVSSPEKVVVKAKEAGMDVVCITDHNSIRGAEVAQRASGCIKGIEVVKGEEITTSDGEVLALFIEEEIPPGLTAVETIRRIREQDGLAIAPHPFSLHCPCLKHLIDQLDLDGIEVLNGGHIDDYSNSEAERASMTGRWARLGGSDSHYLKTVGYAYTNFEGSTAEDLRRSILKKTTSAGGVTIPMTDAIAWSMQVVYHSDILILRSVLGLDKGETEDPIRLKVRGMNAAQRIGALFGSLVYLTPPIPFIVGMKSHQLFRKWALLERTDSQSMGPIWHQ